MRRIAVVGSRSWGDPDLLRLWLDRIRRGVGDFELVSGGAAGADTEAERWAIDRGLPTKIIRPNYAVNGRSATFIRNWEIAQLGECMIAFWDEESGGTKHALLCAVKLKKIARIVTPLGHYYRYEGEGRTTVARD